ncbi:MAG TPA: DUF2243 domain-containing protein, partial [Achromobacter sp.]|nr:DUF2243 domain-containing protein [Achromobacter sp.]
MLAHFLLGFGIWHVVDAVLSHWLTGIHRLRMDVPDPLPWELAWLALFGLLPLMAGWVLGRRGPPAGSGAGGAGGHGPLLSVVLALAVATGALLNLYPVSAPARDTSVVVLRPGASSAGLLKALDQTPARIMWSDATGGVWVLADASSVSLRAL